MTDICSYRAAVGLFSCVYCTFKVKADTNPRNHRELKHNVGWSLSVRTLLFWAAVSVFLAATWNVCGSYRSPPTKLETPVCHPHPARLPQLSVSYLSNWLTTLWATSRSKRNKAAKSYNGNRDRKNNTLRLGH